MARKNYAFTQFGGKTPAAITLEIGNNIYPVVAVTETFAINEIPKAQCILALGTSIETKTRAEIHNTANNLLAMTEAKLLMRLSGDSDLDGQKWPGEVTLFEGFYTGFGYQKYFGQVHMVVYLSHWLMNMAFSSTLSGLSTPDNEYSLAFRAVSDAEGRGTSSENGTTPAEGGSTNASVFMPDVVGWTTDVIQKHANNDMWLALYSVMTAVSNYDGFFPQCANISDDYLKLKAEIKDGAQINNLALKALTRFEGAKDSDAKENTTYENKYVYGKELKYKIDLLPSICNGISGYLNRSTREVANQTMWNWLIGTLCPNFGLLVCPMIDRAITTADTPTWRGDASKADHGYWKTIKVEEYAGIDQSGNLSLPLRAVIAVGNSLGEATETIPGAGVGESCMTGMFASKDVRDVNGTIRYLMIPEWVSYAAANIESSGTVQDHVRNNTAIPTTTTPTTQPTTQATNDKMVELNAQCRDLAAKYAQDFFTRYTLQGRTGTISGKLRFDIAPGSFVKIEGSPDVTETGDKDQLASDLYGQVNRVTITINADQGTASTTLVLTHLRNDEENTNDRTSISENVFFGDNIMRGAPLHELFDRK